MTKDQFDLTFAIAMKLQSLNEQIEALHRINRYEAYRLNDGAVTEINTKILRVETKGSDVRIKLKTEESPIIIDLPTSEKARRVRTQYFLACDDENEYLFIQTSIGTVCMYRLSEYPNT